MRQLAGSAEGSGVRRRDAMAAGEARQLQLGVQLEVLEGAALGGALVGLRCT